MVRDHCKDRMKIILVDWEGYPLRRKKKLGRYAIRCGLGRILENMSRFSAGVEYGVVLVINCTDGSKKGIYERLLKKYEFIERLFFRDNLGQDIGAYNYGYGYLQSIGYQGDVVFMNSSVRGPRCDGWLSRYRDLFYKREHNGLCGISLNSHDTNIMENPPFAPHVQSFFIYTHMRVLQDVFKEGLCGSQVRTDGENGKHLIIQQGEIGISRAVLDAGYSICCIAYEDFFYRKGASWDIPYGDLRTKREFRKFANSL